MMARPSVRISPSAITKTAEDWGWIHPLSIRLQDDVMQGTRTTATTGRLDKLEMYLMLGFRRCRSSVVFCSKTAGTPYPPVVGQASVPRSISALENTLKQ